MCCQLKKRWLQTHTDECDLSGCADNECDIEIGAMHPNVGNTLPNSDNVELIQSFIDIAKKTGQSSKVMDFPPIDHDNPIK